MDCIRCRDLANHIEIERKGVDLEVCRWESQKAILLIDEGKL
jgi:hypothetical protein